MSAREGDRCKLSITVELAPDGMGDVPTPRTLMECIRQQMAEFGQYVESVSIRELVPNRESEEPPPAPASPSTGGEQ